MLKQPPEILRKIWRKIDRRTYVSVVIPVHNGEKTIERCLNALVGQTLKRVKIICVDDGSTDGTAEILARYRRRYRRVKVVTQENGGRSVARNAGIRKVKTEYLMFCDDDDWYEPEMCETMVKVIRGSGSDMGVCGMKIKYEAHSEMKMSDEEYYKVWFEGKKEINEWVMGKTNGSVCNKIFRMDIIRQNKIQFPENLSTAEDFYFCNAYMSVAKTAFFIKKKMYQYVRRADSMMSKNFEAKDLSIDDVLVAKELFEFYKRVGFLDKNKNLFWRQWVASFWASYRYSAKDKHALVEQEAKKFIDKNYAKYKPDDDWICGLVDDVVKTFKKKKGKEK